MLTAITSGAVGDGEMYRRVLEQEDRLIVELPNRLIVVVQEVHTAPVVSAQVWVKTGSIYEQEFTGAGLSHFLEHLLAGGSTSRRSEEETRRILGQIGARTNAATGLDSVHYYINTTREHVNTAIELLSDWMQNAAIRQEEYERERSVIQREFEMGRGDPGRIFWKLTQQARFVAHPARHPTIGYLDEFLQIDREEIYGFYKRMYVPNNMVFVVVGDVNKEAVVQEIAQRWREVPARELPKLWFPVEPELEEPRRMAGVADVRLPRLRLAWPGTRVGEEHDYALDLLAMILGQGESSRLVQRVRNQKRSVVSISAYNLSFHWGKGFFGIDAEVAPGANAEANEAALAKAEADILEEVRRLLEEGIEARELARAKRKVIVQAVLQAQTVEGRAAQLAHDVLAMGDADYTYRYAQAVQSLRAEDVVAAGRAILKEGRMIRVVLMPGPKERIAEELKRPAEPAEAEKFPKEEVELDNAVLVERLLDNARRPMARGSGKVEAVKSFVLANGLRVVVGADRSLPAVAMQFFHAGGLLADQLGREGLAMACARMLIRGTASRSALDIAQEIEDLGASLATDAGNNTWFARAVCLKEDWPKVLEIQADVILHPSFPEDQWELHRPRLVAAIQAQEESWHGELRLRFLPAFFGNHVWSVTPLGRKEVVEKLRVEDLREFYYGHLGASEAVLAVFGDVEVEEVRKRVEELFGGMPARPSVPLKVEEAEPAKARVLQFQTAKPMTAVQIGYGPGPRRADEDYAAVQVLTKVLSNFPSGWLEEELRGRGPGLVYAVGAGMSSGFVPGYVGVVFNCERGSLVEAVRRAMGVVERLKCQLVDPATLERAKAAVLTEEFLSKQTAADRAGEAALNTLYGLGLDEPERFLGRVQNLTAQELMDVAQRYLRNPVVVILSHESVPEELIREIGVGE